MFTAHMFPMYDAGFISLDQQYLTVGINGIVEGAEFLGYEISNNEEYRSWIKNLLHRISSVNKESSEEYSKLFGIKIKINSELIPGESVSVKFAKWDKKAGYKVPRDCYNSYLYIVEDDSVDFIDKFQLHGGDILQYLDGGSALHLNLKETPSSGTWEKIIDIATKAGCNYFTYNVRGTICNECGYISKQDLDYCYKCGTKNVDHLTRVIGYLKRISSFSKDRQLEEGLRFYHGEH
jgi:ribonucleoside-triphosphate reductase